MAWAARFGQVAQVSLSTAARSPFSPLDASPGFQFMPQIHQVAAGSLLPYDISVESPFERMSPFRGSCCVWRGSMPTISQQQAVDAMRLGGRGICVEVKWCCQHLVRIPKA